MIAMNILMDGWHLRSAKSGGGIARDSVSIAKGLAEICNLTIVVHKKKELFEFHSDKIERASEYTIKMRSILGMAFDINTSADIFFVPQILPIKNSKAMLNLVRVHDLFPITNPEWFPWPHKTVFSRQFKRVLKTESIFVTNSRRTEFILHQFFDVPKSRIKVFECRVMNLNEECCLQCDACEFTGKTDMNYRLMVGTIEPRKNYTLPISIYSENKISIPLVIVGRNGWKSGKIVKKLRRSPNIFWLQNSCDGALRRLYENASSFISTSLDEGFNLPAAEAGLFSAPLILSDIPIHRELYPSATFIGLDSRENWANYLKRREVRIDQPVRPLETDDEFNTRLLNLLESLQ